MLLFIMDSLMTTLTFAMRLFIILTIRKKGGKRYMDIKMDMAKVYDTLEWNFI